MSDEYKRLLRDPRWQKKRLEVFERAGFRCQCCGSSRNELHAHHLFYRKSAAPWEYHDGEIVAVCDSCHESEHEFGDEAWRDLKTAVVALGGYHEAASYLADAFGGSPLRQAEWPALARCIRVMLEMRGDGKDFADIARHLDELALDWNAGRDDAGFAAWLASLNIEAA